MNITVALLSMALAAVTVALGYTTLALKKAEESAEHSDQDKQQSRSREDGWRTKCDALSRMMTSLEVTVSNEAKDRADVEVELSIVVQERDELRDLVVDFASILDTKLARGDLAKAAARIAERAGDWLDKWRR